MAGRITSLLDPSDRKGRPRLISTSTNPASPPTPPLPTLPPLRSLEFLLSHGRPHHLAPRSFRSERSTPVDINVDESCIPSNSTLANASPASLSGVPSFAWPAASPRSSILQIGKVDPG